MKPPLKIKNATPPKEPTVRIPLSIPKQTADLIKQAATIRGQSVSKFIVETMTREADRVV